MFLRKVRPPIGFLGAPLWLDLYPHPPEGFLPSRQLFQSLRRLVHCFRPLAERETYLLGSVLRMLIKARSRHARDPNLLHQVPRKLDIVLVAKRADVGHHVIRPLRTITAEPCPFECRNQMAAPSTILVR